MSALTVATGPARVISLVPEIAVPQTRTEVRTGSAPARQWVVTLLDGSRHEIVARDVAELGGRLSFFSGAVHDEVPEAVAVFRSSLVAYWRIVA